MVTAALRALGRASLLDLAAALRSGRLAHPFSRPALAALLPAPSVAPVHAALHALATDGMASPHVALLLETLADERLDRQRLDDRLELVLSPPELDRVDARDTAVLVRDLFRRAERSVLIVTYALDSGDKASALFGDLAHRMDTEPALDVTLCVNVPRPWQDDAPAPELLRRFATRLRAELWPGHRLPRVFHDPRALDADSPKRASLHAKVVVVDRRLAFVTSANFTEAAQARNLEAGLAVDAPHLADRLARQFEALIARGDLRPVPL